MRMIVCTGLFAIALLVAVLAAIGAHSSTWVAAGDDGDSMQASSHRSSAAAAPLAKARP